MSEKYYWLNEDSRLFLERGYLEGRETPESRIRNIGKRAEEILKKEGFAKKFEDYMSRGWYSLASPIWANYGKERGLPISCFGSYIDDTMEEILYTVSEVGMMSKMGGGTSAYFGHLRGRGSEIKSGGHSSGPVHFMELFETVTNVVSQSNVRRGSFAGYLNIDHPDVDEFLSIRNEGNPIQNMSFGVTVSDKWMKAMVEGDKDKRKTWGKVIKKRFESGYPYIMFSDNVNKHKPKVYKDQKKTIWGSNLCSEICLSTEVGQSFVCCLSSMNLLHYDDWKDTDAVEVLTYFLDSLLNKTKKRIIITTGLVPPKILETFIKNNNNQNIVIHKNLNFFELENIVLNADVLISCHGALSHVAAAGNIKQIDIIDKSYNYKFWTKHFRNYTPVERDSFESLSFKLLSLI